MVTAQLPPFARPGINHRRPGLLHRRRHQPGRRHPADDAAQGPGRQHLCRGPGAAGRWLHFLWRQGGQGPEKFPHRRSHLRRCDCRAGRRLRSAAPTGDLLYQLRETDFTTAARMTEAINSQFGDGTAHSLDSALDPGATVPEATRVTWSTLSPTSKTLKSSRHPGTDRGQRAHRHHRHGQECPHLHRGGLPRQPQPDHHRIHRP